MRSTGLWVLLMPLVGVPGGAVAGWPFSADGPRRGSVEWYEQRAADPIGQRQVVKFGKLWPVDARPMGEPAPLIHRLHHNLYWPYPYDDLDKASVQEWSDLQVLNGWQDATTFYDYHFEPESQALNRSGRERLYYLMSRVPAEFRTAYVQASMVDPSLNGLRITSVQNEAARFVGPDQTPPVLLRVATPHGTPAADVDAIFQYRRANLTPPPVLSGNTGVE